MKSITICKLNVISYFLFLFSIFYLFLLIIICTYCNSSIVSTFHNVVFSSSPAVAIFVPSGDHRHTRIPVPELTKEDFAWLPFCQRKLSSKREAEIIVYNSFHNEAIVTSVSQIKVVPSSEQEASIEPHGLNST